MFCFEFGSVGNLLFVVVFHLFFCSFECYGLRYSYSQISLLSSLFVKICCSVSFVANFVYFRYVNSATNKCSVQLKNSTKTPSLFRCVCFFFSRSASKYDFANKKREIAKIVALLLSSNKCRIQYTFNVFFFLNVLLFRRLLWLVMNVDDSPVLFLSHTHTQTVNYRMACVIYGSKKHT